MKRYVTAALGAFAFLFAGGGAAVDAAAQAQKPLTRVVAAMGSPGLIWTPLYVAKEKGFLAEEGLEVHNLTVEGANALTAVLTGDAHVAFGTAHLILARSKGEKLKAIVPMQEQFGAALLLSNAAIQSTGITPEMSVEDKLKRLKGLRIGISAPGATIDILIRALTSGVGLKPDQDLKLVPFGGDGVPMLAALERNAIDGFMYVAPWPEEAIARGLGRIVINPTIGEVKEVAGVSFLAFYGQEKWLESSPEQALGFTRAIAKALRFVHQEPKATLDILRKYVPDARPEVLQAAFDNYLKSVPKDPRIPRESMDKAVYFFNLGKPVERQVKQSYEELVAPQFAEQAAKDLGF